MRRAALLWLVWDLLLATALVTSGEVEIATGATYEGLPTWRGPLPATVVLVALLAAPVLLRRLLPRIALVGGIGLLVVDTVVLGGTQSGVGFVFAAVVLYSAAAHIERAWPSIAGWVVLAVVIITLPGALNGVGDIVFFLLVSLLPLGLGRAVQVHLRQVQVLRRQRVELERLHAAEVEAATAAERAGIARELHDIVAHAVSVVVVQAQAGARVLDDSPEHAKQAFAVIEASGRDALTELRRLLTVLTAGDHDGVLAPSPRIADVPALVQRMRDAGLEVRLQQDPLPGLPAAAELAVHRTVQEALTNALKHAPGEAVTVRLTAREGGVAVLVTNRVVSAPAAVPGTARGLIGMRERIALVGGAVALGVVDGAFTVDALVPADARA